jgi:hypothetical protein
MTVWRWTLLISELFLFALILVLRQVDLPATTFREGAAPVVVRLQFAAPPAMPPSVGSHAMHCLRKMQEFVHKPEWLAYGLSWTDRRFLVCTLLC